MTSALHATNSGPPWLVRSGRRTRAPIGLVCFSHAGGGSSAYARWEEELPRDIEVYAVQLPGRETRIRERAMIDMRAVAQAIVESLLQASSQRWLLFGHSLGAVVAYEVAQRLQRSAQKHAAGLVVSAASTPETIAQLNDYSALTDDEMIAELSQRYDAIPQAILRDQDILQLYSGILRADLQLLGSYRYGERGPLTCPIFGIFGTHDRVATAERMQGWARHTSAGFALTGLSGGHFYLHEQRQPTLDVIANIARTI